MNALDEKINQWFPGLVVRKDLVKTVKGNAIVPTYVLEYLLGQYCATNDEATIQTGIETVKEILRKHYVHRNESGLIRSTIREKGRHKVIDKISVALNDRDDVYEAAFANLGIKKLLVDSGTVKAYPRMLVSGVWCIADIEYAFTEDKSVCPWILSSIKPIQLSHLDFDGYVEARKQFTMDEWIDLLMQSIGFNPEMFGKRSKLTQLTRLIPYCERNYNLIELGPKGTGKSHIYSEFSPHGILISGGEVTVPKLFVNNTTGKIGLVGYWDVVTFDEFAGKQKRADKALVDIMKNYMANKSFSRGVETIGAEASMVFVGNTRRTVPYMLKHSDLFDELPDKFHDSAFLDRMHFYIPGWEVDIIRGEMFSNGYGFVVDYLAEILRALRSHDYSDRYKEHFSLSSDISTRDRDGINKTFSGLMKILFPHGGASKEEVEELLRFAIEGRKRVKDQLMRIDSTYPTVRFIYRDTSGQPGQAGQPGQPEQLGQSDQSGQPGQAGQSGQTGQLGQEGQAGQSGQSGQSDQSGRAGQSRQVRQTRQDGQAKPVTTLEEEEYPFYYHKTIAEGLDAEGADAIIDAAGPHVTNKPFQTVEPGQPSKPVQTSIAFQEALAATASSPKELHVTYQENQHGISFDMLFGPYIQGASKITITEPYTQHTQLVNHVRNLMEFLETVVKYKPKEEEVAVHLVTTEDESKVAQQKEHFEKIKESCSTVGIDFTWEFGDSRPINTGARHIITDHGWKILLTRGLDIFQHYEMHDDFTFANRLQQFRPCKAFEVTYVKNLCPSGKDA